MGRFGRVAGGVALTAALMVGAGVTFAPAPGTAQDEDLRPTVEAMQTQISTLQTQVADLMPPTPKPGVTPSPTKARSGSTGGGTGRSLSSPSPSVHPDASAIMS